jgi:hypothetical protein
LEPIPRHPVMIRCASAVWRTDLQMQR